MTAYCIYLIVLLALIRYTGFFGVFDDEAVSRKKLTIFFFLKALAVPIFYIFYQKVYGGIEKFDTGKYFHDAAVISDFAKQDLNAYLRLLIGMQDDSAGSYDYVSFLVKTENWDNGQLKDYFYNDNRVVIRLHSLIHFIAFNSWFVHALFNCLISFAGIFYLYRSFGEYFHKKEMAVLAVLCFFPSLWFYTGALLKEGIVIYVMGCLAWHLKQATDGSLNIKGWVWLFFLLYVSVLLKPYLLLFSAACFLVFFFMREKKLKGKSLWFLAMIVCMGILINIVSITLKGKTVFKAALEQRTIFADVASGGIFLLDNHKFVRMKYDTNLVVKMGADRYRIKQGVPFYYWEHSHQKDTLYCRANMDTLTEYQLVYQIPESRSNIDIQATKNNIYLSVFSSLYYSLAHPLFFNAKSPVQVMASFENLLLIASLLFVAIRCYRSGKDRFLPFVFVLFTLSLCLLVGYTSPNLGAISRYRAPAVIFIVLAAVYYLPFNFRKS